MCIFIYPYIKHMICTHTHTSVSVYIHLNISIVNKAPNSKPAEGTGFRELALESQRPALNPARSLSSFFGT